MRNARTRPASAGRDRGVAMIMVLAMGTVLTLLVGTALALSLSGVIKSNTDQDWTGAMAAAYAGVEEYSSHIANDNTYQQYGDKNAPFSLASPTLVLPTGTKANPAFGLGTSGTWADVPGSGGASSFRYEVDSSKYNATGVLRVRSTGRVGTATRSLVANLRQTGFIDFLYFTDYEIQDPEISGVNAANCTKYVWEGRPSGCSEIAFGSADIINGPMHSNDAVRICDATFAGVVTTAYNPASGVRYIPKNSLGSSCNGQIFKVAGSPSYAPVIGMPPTNAEMKKEVRTDLPSEVSRPGCLYTGPTEIKFHSDGTMTVRSPWTKMTRVAGSPATSGTAPAECGVVGQSAGQLGSPGGATFQVPEQNLIFVQNVPSTSSTDPNYTALNSYPTTVNCSTSWWWGTIRCYGDSGTSGDGNGIGYPAAVGSRDERAPSSTSYGYRNGDVFVEGDVNGAVTVAAENFVYVTGNIKYVDSSTDVLGLVGNNAVWVWNPVTSGSNSVLTDFNRRIDAAILSVAHTFQVQNYSQGGNRGELTVNGAIAQKFRGIVRSGGDGYSKNYVYDPRLRYIAPPKFLSPVSTSYGVSVLVEVKSAFKADGAPSS